MDQFDNVTRLVRDDLKKTIGKGSRLSMAAACFSIYAFDALKKELLQIDRLRFFFTSPTFLKCSIPIGMTRPGPCRMLRTF